MIKFKNLKLVVLDNDDTLFRSSPLINAHVERNWPQFSSQRLRIKERVITMVQYQYEEILKEIKRAQKNHEIPKLKELNINRNDVIKTGNPKLYTDFDEYYRIPLLEALEALEEAKFQKEMFLEERDATLEADGKKDANEGKIPYDLIYHERNWFPYVRQNVNDLYDIFGERLISLTAHNGIDDDNGRELAAKGDAIRRINPNIKHYGLRFHNREHIDGERRERNSKPVRIQNLFDLPDLQGVAVVEDSLAVLKMVYLAGGIPIYVNQNNNPNPENFAMVRSVKAESILRELANLGWEDGVGVQKPAEKELKLKK